MSDPELRDHFTKAFGVQPDVLVRSPGRVNLIGEHTDYNEGWVLPAALSIGTVVAARRRDTGVLHTITRRLNAEDRTRVDDLRPTDGPEWTRYVRGVAALLQATGCAIPGADLLIDSDLPLGSGLSSSASLELGVAVALMTLGNTPINPTVLARLGQRVENEIVGVQSGIMDQLTVACGVAGHALLIDCRSLVVDPVPIPAEVHLLILDTGVPRTLAGSAYNQRRGECEAALRKLQAIRPELRALRDVTPELLMAEGWRLAALELRRVRHVVTEDQRVLEGAAALRRGDAATFGRLMVASHASLRDDYEVSSAALDRMVATALATPGVLGARLTGAGFGGCVVALIEVQHAEPAAATITEAYRQATGRTGSAYICAPSAGAVAHWITSSQEGSGA